MRLFDLLPEERHGLKRFIFWHVGFALYYCVVFFVIYRLHLFKAYWFLHERWIVNMWAPIHTIIFIAVGPYRRDWIHAIANLYQALDRDIVFCLMALMVGGVGFYLYSLIILLAGALLPAMVFN